MRKFSIGILMVVVVLMTSCKCSAEKAAVDRLQGQQEKIFAKYSAYVAQDPALNAGAKDDELKLLQSVRDIVSSLKRSLED